MIETVVFRISYTCNNCGKDWFEGYAKGDEVRRTFDGYSLASHACKHEFGCTECRHIKCPNCESRNVTIKERKPA